MSLPYETSSAKDPLSELQKVLNKFGCSTFGTMMDTERGLTIVQFSHRGRRVTVEASWKGYAQALLKQRRARGPAQEARALAQAKISVGCCLRDWIKGQVTAVECGVMSFEAAFMPHMLLADGRRMLDHVQSNNLLPPPS